MGLVPPGYHKWLAISSDVERAISANRAIVALETTVIAHGLPFPENIATARDCEAAVRDQGAVPATIGLADGVVRVGMPLEEIEAFATSTEPIAKVSLSNLAAVLSSARRGATTVAATLKLAHAAGIRVLSTGGIGGVHRGAAQTFDVSADLPALASTPMICVCSGAKAILDLEKTLEALETLGVVVVGYKTDEFPAFYSRTSGLKIDRVESVDEAAHIASLHWNAGLRTAILFCIPVPESAEMEAASLNDAIARAVELAMQQNIRGKTVTPFLLSALEKFTDGRTLVANRALLVNNAFVAAQVAQSLTSH